MTSLPALRPLALTAARAQNPKQDPPAADLIIEDIEPSDSFPRNNEPVFFDVTVKNQGNADAPPFNVRITSDGLNQEARLDKGLAAGKSETIAQMGPLWTDSFQSMYWVDAQADAENEVKESRKDNNESSISLMTEPTPPPFPQPPLPPMPPHPHKVLLAE